MEVNLPLLISPSELNTLLENDQFDEKYRIVEVHMNPNGLEDYSKGHIKKAIFVNMMHEVVKSDVYPFDIPQVEPFENYLSSLGIGNKHHIIIYDKSDLGFGFSPRMWSVLRLFGHKKISILKGGFNSWKANEFSVSLETPSFQAEKFDINVNYSLLRYYEQIRKNLKTQHETILDARPEEDFKKINDGEKINHIPNSINVPFSELFDKDGIKSRTDLDTVFRTRGVNLRRRLITSCNTGVKACVLQLALYLVGLETVPVYYGSWTEYSKKDEEESKYTFKRFGPEESNNTNSSICVLL